jgi:hypothetical protein
LSDARLSVLLSARDELGPVLNGVGRELGMLDQKYSMANAGEKFGQSLVSLGKTAAGFALGGAVLGLGNNIAEQFGDAIKTSVDLGKEVRRLQLDIGGSAESVSALLAVFHRFGMEGADAERTLTMFSKKLHGDFSATDAAESNPGVFAGVIKELGIQSTDATGKLRPINDILLDVAEAFKAHALDGANGERAMQLFGKTGKDLVPILVLGRDGIVELEAEAKKMGLVLSQDNVDDVRKFVKSQKDAAEAVEGLKVQMGIGMLPAFSMFASGAASAAAGLNLMAQSAPKALNPIKQFLDSGYGEELKRMSLLSLATLALGPLGLPAVIAGSFIPGIGTDSAEQTAAKEQQANAAATAAAFANEQQAGVNLARQAATGKDDEATKTKQLKDLNDQIAAGDRQKAIIAQAITLATRENLDLKKSEAELQLELLPLKAQQADIDQQLLIMADKRGALERDAAVTRAQMASQASSDALEGADFEERRLRLKIKADAIGGRGVKQGDINELKSLAMNRPQLELDALLGGRGATLAERDRTRAQQAQDLATLPLREQRAALDEQMAGMNAQSADIQRQIDEARLHGVVDTTPLEKRKRELDDALFAAGQKKQDLEGKGVAITQTFTFNSNGEVDYQKVVDLTFKATMDALKGAQANTPTPAPVSLAGARGAGTAGRN